MHPITRSPTHFVHLLLHFSGDLADCKYRPSSPPFTQHIFHSVSPSAHRRRVRPTSCFSIFLMSIRTPTPKSFVHVFVCVYVSKHTCVCVAKSRRRCGAQCVWNLNGCCMAGSRVVVGVDCHRPGLSGTERPRTAPIARDCECWPGPLSEFMMVPL